MKKGTIDRERTVVAHNQASEVSQPGISAFHDPSPLVTSQDSSVLGGRTDAILLVRADQFDSALPQALPQRIAVVGFVGNHAHRLLPRTARVMAASYPDRRERRLREFDFRQGCRVFPRGRPRPSTTTIHFVPLPRLVFPTPQPLFSPERNCRPETLRSISLAGARLTRSKTFARYSTKRPAPPSRAVAASTSKDAGISPAGRALRRIQRIPSSTRRFSIHGRPPLRCLGGLGSKGAIFFHCASVSNGPDRAIGPPSALLTLLIPHFTKLNHSHFRGLS